MFRVVRPLVLLILIFSLATPVLAQTPEFRLDPQRNFGYGAGADVRGDFTLRTYGDHKIIRSVTYLIDGIEMGTVDTEPFEFKFKTGQYSSGWHDLVAVVETTDGRTVTTPTVRLNFLSAQQEAESFQRIIIPLLVGILVVTIGGSLLQTIVLRGDTKRLALGAPRHYGLKGGTICPRCNRPYAIHFWSFNLMVGKLDRCDYCGKWAIVRRYDPSVLAAAEETERELARAAESAPISANGAQTHEEDRLRKMLDETRYTEKYACFSACLNTQTG